MSSRKRGLTPSRDAIQRKKSAEVTESIEVVCRLCPYDGPSPSLIPIDETTVKTVLPPAQFKRDGASNVEKLFSFGRIFNPDDEQSTVFERTTIDLIVNLLRGQNSLLFTYGVTGSGKTYTMTGKPTQEETGILPRTLDVVFNSIQNQTEKCVFIPAPMNTFDINSGLEAHLKRRKLEKDVVYTNRNITDRYFECMKVGEFNEDYVCSIFVNYVEIYNNYCYDLLEDARNASMTKRELRHDRNHQIFVDGAKDVEVSNSEEALQVFYLGEERRRISSTLLNKDSSRSHSVFTIKLVMAPRAYDSQSIYPIIDPSKIIVSQLCLVDLAGSERAKRTQNSGDRLAEANSINQSLMVLRQCIDVLRRNQRIVKTFPEQIPYRQSKLTHLFKNYLEGNGKIRMIICVNPKPDDFYENISALSFAEESQTIEMKKQVDKIQNDRIPHSFYTQWNSELDGSIGQVKKSSEITKIPTFCIRNYNDISTIEAIRRYATKLENNSQEENSSSSLLSSVREYMLKADHMKTEIERLKQQLDEKDSEITKLKGFCSKYKREATSLRERVKNCEEREEENRIEMERLRAEKMEDLKTIQTQKKAIRLVQGIMETPSPSVSSMKSRIDQQNDQENTFGNMEIPQQKMNENLSATTTEISKSRRLNGKQGHINPKYKRRSKSASRLLDHQPAHKIPTGNVLQPKTPTNAIQTTHPQLNQLTKSVEYRLTHQEVDIEGNIQTNIIKGDVIPTVGGGTTVLFNDIEKLTHESLMNNI